MPLMKADQFFIHALHATADYDAALVLTLLASLGAIEDPVRSTVTRLTDDANGVLTRLQMWRATNRLGVLGLLSVKVHPNTWSEYHVDHAALGEFGRRAVFQLKRLTELMGQSVCLPEALVTELAAPDVVLPTSCAETSQLPNSDG